jgi:DNA-binding LacI/PurR family transcriptional regulator
MMRPSGVMLRLRRGELKRGLMTKKSVVTAKDVAQRAGVSQSTVSRVLNNTGTDFISEATKERVRKAVEDLGYAPNPYARALRGKKTNLIGLIVREIADPFFSSLISEISLQANVLGYRVVLGPAHSDPNEAYKLIMTFSRHQDGAIIIGDLRNDEAIIQKIFEGFPAVVTMCRGSKMKNVSTVNTDNKEGMRLLLDHLVELGHKNFAFLDGGWLGDNRDRREMFVEYLQDAKLAVNPEWIQVAENTPAGGYEVMQKLLRSSNRPTALLAADDVMAIGAMKAIADAKIKIPEDLSITGFDGLDLANYVCPSLTTIRQPVEEMSSLALKNLIEVIDGGAPQNKIFQVEPELIVKQSTGPAPTS